MLVRAEAIKVLARTDYTEEVTLECANNTLTLPLRDLDDALLNQAQAWGDEKFGLASLNCSRRLSRLNRK
jgi:hypothetical protein